MGEDWDRKTLYFINAWFYSETRISGRVIPSSFLFEACLYFDEERSMTLEFPSNGYTTVEEIEAKIAIVYDHLGCVPDAHNN